MLAAIAMCGAKVFTQASAPSNDLPNPYRMVENYFKLPTGRSWGATGAVDVDRDGKSIWVAERCGGRQFAPCAGSRLDPVLKFDASGALVKSFGAGLFIFPHGIFVDQEDNVWVTDGQDDTVEPERRAGPDGPAVFNPNRNAQSVVPQARATRGHQVFKFSPDGKLLTTLGRPGGAAAPDYFFQPNDVLVAPNGDIFVSEGHGEYNARMLKFTKDGILIKTWGKRGTAPGEFDQPHALAMDSRGRLFVGDRGNNRIQIFDQDGNFIEQWSQFSRPSGLFIDKQDNVYVADSESGSARHSAWKRGIRIGSAKDGKVRAFIPDPEEHPTGSSAAEGVAADSQGNIYGAEVGRHDVKKYAKK